MSRKLAVGILASAAPSVLCETLAHWPEETCSVYVHVDSKRDLDAFSFVADHRCARVIPTRHRVMWGGFSLVDAELALMKAALDDGFEYFLLISDDTVPLQPATEIMRRLGMAEMWYRLQPTPASSEVWSRYNDYYCADIQASNPRQPTLKYETSDADYLLDLYLLMKTGKAAISELFWCSNWKVLSQDDVEYTIRMAADRGHLHASFRFSISPDEHYIPTLLGQRRAGMRCVENLIWADFSRDPRPFVIHDLAELEAIAERNFLFARKIHDRLLARTLILNLASTATAEV